MTQSTAHSPFSYRTVDLMVMVMVGIAFGVAFAGYAALYQVIDPVTSLFPPSQGLLAGGWCLPAVISMLIIRRPGAGLGAEVIASSVSALMGSYFGLSAIYSGILQGIGVEIVFAIALWRTSSWVVTVGASIMTVSVEWVYEIIAYYPEWSLAFKLIMLVLFWVSACILLAPLARLIVIALVKAGALNAFPAARELTAPPARTEASALPA